MGTPLQVTLCISLAPFKILSLTFGILIMMCLGVVLYVSILFGILCVSWTCMSISLAKLGNFSFIIFSNKSPISCSFSSPSGTPSMQMLECLKLSQRLLTVSSGLFICLLFFLLRVVLIGCFLLPCVPNHYLIPHFIHSTVISL